MPTRLKLSTDRRQDGVLVLTASGELDLSNVSVFSDAIATGVAGADGSPLRVDLSAIQYLDSGAINVLFDHAESISVVVNPVLIPVLNISGLTGVTTVESSTGL